MSASTDVKVGAVMWTDLTVKDAKTVRDFYRKVVGWKAVRIDMGGYNDYCMKAPETGKTVAGICHARGTNGDLPPQWLIYITVEDIDESVARCAEFGGKVMFPPKDMAGQGRYCVIEDPAGAVAALFEPA